MYVNINGIYSGHAPSLALSIRAVNRIWSRRPWGPKAPTQARGLGAADAPNGVQGQSPVGVPGGKQNEFNVWRPVPKIDFPYLFSISFEVQHFQEVFPTRKTITIESKKLLLSLHLQ